jgi:hypothetical protein
MPTGAIGAARDVTASLVEFCAFILVSFIGVVVASLQKNLDVDVNYCCTKAK